MKETHETERENGGGWERSSGGRGKKGYSVK